MRLVLLWFGTWKNSMSCYAPAWVKADTMGLLSVEEGRFADGQGQHGRWLNGDQTHQGRHIRLEPGRFTIQRVRLYGYR